ncbi:MAG: PD-(D/E)XK nuclease family protein [Candidatus Staskawiczbacteria bacterium]|nr:PD-(D/E)XK nuclease family protein [Candidatus Staskawiczbacteria bacterium]
MKYKVDDKKSSDEKTGILADKVKGPKGYPNRLKAKTQPQYLPEHFSYSQLAAFEKCPLQYKFGFILKVPTRGKSVFSFGKTMHNTLEEFLKTKKTFEDLIEIYENNWIDEWYENQKQKDDYFKKGKDILKEFYKQYSKNPPKILKVNGQIALELPFNLKVGDYTLYGVIDRIDEDKDGISIIDYKTGQSKEKLDFSAKEQLLIYQIAAQEVLHLKPKQLSYYYLDDNTFASFIGTEQDIAVQKAKILEDIEKIKNSEFDATPGWQCQYCDFKDICDHAER